MDSGTINETVAEQDTLTGSFQSQLTTGTISLTFNQIYNRDSAFSYVEGNWSGTSGSYSINLTIDASGGISGSDSDGCIATGVVSILDPDHDLYGVDDDYAQCGVYNGSYSGFAGLTDNNTENDTLSAAVSNDSYIFLYSLTRQ